MKQLTFIRHAKSDWGDELLKDIDRPLSERGYKDAYNQSKWYAQHQPIPDLVLSSTATRALSTALIFARCFELDMQNFVFEKDVYECSVDTLLSIIRKQSNDKQNIFIFGHNPAFTNVCNELSTDLFFDNVPTCGMVSFHFDLKKWKDLSVHTGNLNFQQFPKEFKN